MPRNDWSNQPLSTFKICSSTFLSLIINNWYAIKIYTYLGRHHILMIFKSGAANHCVVGNQTTNIHIFSTLFVAVIVSRVHCVETELAFNQLYLSSLYPYTFAAQSLHSLASYSCVVFHMGHKTYETHTQTLTYTDCVWMNRIIETIFALNYSR